MKEKIIVITTFLLITCCLSAQEQKDRSDYDIGNNEFSLSLGAGCAYMMDGIAGLSSYSKSYNNKMRFGADYNFQFEYRHSRFVIGAMASVFNSSGSAEFSSDNIFINNFAVQTGGYWLLPELHKFSLKTTAGLGIITYTNSSKVFGKKRHISENTVGLHILNEAAYRFSPNWAIAINMLLAASEQGSFDVNYHGETFEVKQTLPLSKISISAGIKYTF